MCQSDDFGSISQAVVAGKLGHERSVHLIIDSRCGAAHAGLDPGTLGFLSCLFAGSFETSLVDGAAALSRHILGGVDGESIGIIKKEGILAGDLGLAFSLELFEHAAKDLETLVDGLLKALFLETDIVEDELLLLFQLGITALGTFDDSLCEGGHKCLADAQLAALADGAADQTAKDIAAALVCGHNAVGDHKGRGTDVVGDDTDRNVSFMIFAVLAVSQLTDLVAQGADCVDIKEGLDILHCDSQTLHDPALREKRRIVL